MEKQYDENKLIASLSKSTHGKLEENIPLLEFARIDPKVFAHVVAWNHLKGSVRDTKASLPILGLRGASKKHPELAESNIAALALLPPRELMKAYKFNRTLVEKGLIIPDGFRKKLEWALRTYLLVRELDEKWWNAAVLRNRKAMLYLYKVSHKKPSAWAQRILFEKDYPKKSVFGIIKNLSIMTPLTAAAMILKHKIPMQVAIGAGAKLQDDNVILALLEGMSANELMNNTKFLKELGVFENTVLKTAYDHALVRARSDKNANLLRTQKVLEVVEDNTIAAKIKNLERSHSKRIGGIEGNWLVLADRSYSMNESIILARHVSAALASQVKGEVHLMFFDDKVDYFNVSQKEFSDIEKETRFIRSRGMTSIGIGLQYAVKKGLSFDGIAVVSDGGENEFPLFCQEYRSLALSGRTPTVYFYKIKGDRDKFSDNCKASEISIETFDLTEGQVDLYSIPTLVKTMRTNRFSLRDEIMETELFTFRDVFKS